MFQIDYCTDVCDVLKTYRERFQRKWETRGFCVVSLIDSILFDSYKINGITITIICTSFIVKNRS